jgi:hypothetical protein
VAWALCILSVTLALASVTLATFNGENPIDLIANHHAIGIVDALTLPLVGALIVARDRRNLLAWLLIVGNLFLGVFNFAAQYAPLALGLTSRRLSLPGGDFASWLAAWTMVPGIVVGLVFLVLLFPDGRVPSPRWQPVAWAGAVTLIAPTVILAVGSWPYRGPSLITHEGTLPPLVDAMFGIAFQLGLLLGAVSTVALILRYRRAGTVQRQQIKWFAYGAILSIPLGLFPEADPWGPYLEFLGTVLLIAGVGIGILRYRLWDIDRLVNRTLCTGCSPPSWPAATRSACWCSATPSAPDAARPAWSWRRPRWWSRRCSSRCAAASSTPSTGGSTDATTTRPGRSRRSPPGSASTPTCRP